MASKKYYAVKKGKVTGVFENWEECKASVDGYPGAEYKGFPTLREAQSFAGISESDIRPALEKLKTVLQSGIKNI